MKTDAPDMAGQMGCKNYLACLGVLKDCHNLDCAAHQQISAYEQFGKPQAARFIVFGQMLTNLLVMIASHKGQEPPVIDPRTSSAHAKPARKKWLYVLFQDVHLPCKSALACQWIEICLR